MDNEKEIMQIDLFSGIGGFTLAGEWAGFRTVVFCEKEEFCQRVLQKRFGAVIADSESMERRNGIAENKGKKSRKINSFSNKAPLLIPEIRDFDGTKWRGATLLTGGFPCQPFSVAGQRRGKEDDRYLWPEMLRVINEAKPRWILAENVPGIFRMALDTVLADLESEGYAPGTFIIPACGLDAPHRRNRVWIVANSIDDGMRRGSHGNSGGGKRTLQTKRPNSHAPDSESRMPRKQAEQKRRENSGRRDIEIASNSDRFNGNNAGFSSGEISQQKKTEIQRSDDPYTPHSYSSRSQVGEMFRQNIRQKCPPLIRNAWQEDWYEVAARFCRVDDGIPDRIHRLKALGNAIVPQVAYEILKRIAWIENERATD